jgi:uncharacterized protein YjbI with pentapeptide repeats
MAGREITIKAVDAVHCIRSGMSDTELMEKFGLSSAPLHNLFEQLVRLGILKESELVARASLDPGSVVVDLSRLEIPPPPVQKKPVIDAADALRCLKAGMDDCALMKRYNVSARGLQSLFDKLVSRGVIARAFLDRRSDLVCESVLVNEEVPEVEDVSESGTWVDEDVVIEAVKAGMDYKDIMEKYNCSARRLRILVKRVQDTEKLAARSDTSTSPPQVKQFQIRRRQSGGIIFEGEAESLAAAVQKAVSMNVDLTEAELAKADLSKTDLSGARLSRANLRAANLMGTDLTAANLSEAILASANLCGAILHKTNLACADLTESNLTLAFCVWAFMPKANLSEADLSKADLAGANLGGANLFEAIFSRTNLTGAYLTGAMTDNARGLDYALG